MTYIYRPQRPRHIGMIGSRHITDYRRFCLTIRGLHILTPRCVIVSGRSPGGGVDLLAARFARQNGYELLEHPVDMELVKQKESEGLDRRAAFSFAACARNSLVVRDSDLMVAIACDHSSGTYDSIRKMKVKIQDESAGSNRGGSQTIRLYNYIWECGQK